MSTSRRSACPARSFGGYAELRAGGSSLRSRHVHRAARRRRSCPGLLRGLAARTPSARRSACRPLIVGAGLDDHALPRPRRQSLRRAPARRDGRRPRRPPRTARALRPSRLLRGRPRAPGIPRGLRGGVRAAAPALAHYAHRRRERPGRSSFFDGVLNGSAAALAELRPGACFAGIEDLRLRGGVRPPRPCRDGSVREVPHATPAPAARRPPPPDRRPRGSEPRRELRRRLPEGDGRRALAVPPERRRRGERLLREVGRRLPGARPEGREGAREGRQGPPREVRGRGRRRGRRVRPAHPGRARRPLRDRVPPRGRPALGARLRRPRRAAPRRREPGRREVPAAARTRSRGTSSGRPSRPRAAARARRATRATSTRPRRSSRSSSRAAPRSSTRGATTRPGSSA